ALVGRAIGAARRASLTAAAGMTTSWAAGIAMVISAVLAMLGTAIIDLLTIDGQVRATARIYLPWAVTAPLLGVWAFQLDGIFIGSTRTIDMRNSMLVSLGIFLTAWWALQPLGNHGLWAAFHVHFIARVATLAYF